MIYMLTKEEITRYSKQLLLPGIGMKGQEKLKDAKVLVIGAGGLGCPVLQYLAAAGVGSIGIVDFDSIDITNLHRQVLYADDDIGKEKAIIATSKIAALNPFIKLETFNVELEYSNARKIISGYDIIVDCTDNFETRYIINDVCVLSDKPFVYGGIHKFEGQLSVFNYSSIDGKPGPTYRCLFPENKDDEVADNCSVSGVIGVLPGMIGTMQANEVIKMITGIGNVCSGKLLIFNSLNNIFTEIKVKRNEAVWGSMLKSMIAHKTKFTIPDTFHP
jgi:molybdopterin/thiamine biosynthesis adenylyltransferase